MFGIESCVKLHFTGKSKRFFLLKFMRISIFSSDHAILQFVLNIFRYYNIYYLWSDVLHSLKHNNITTVTLFWLRGKQSFSCQRKGTNYWPEIKFYYVYKSLISDGKGLKFLLQLFDIIQNSQFQIRNYVETIFGLEFISYSR